MSTRLKNQEEKLRRQMQAHWEEKLRRQMQAHWEECKPEDKQALAALVRDKAPDPDMSPYDLIELALAKEIFVLPSEAPSKFCFCGIHKNVIHSHAGF